MAGPRGKLRGSLATPKAAARASSGADRAGREGEAAAPSVTRRQRRPQHRQEPEACPRPPPAARTFWRICPDVETLRMSFCREPGSCSGSLSDDSSGAAPAAGSGCVCSAPAAAMLHGPAARPAPPTGPASAAPPSGGRVTWRWRWRRGRGGEGPGRRNGTVTAALPLPAPCQPPERRSQRPGRGCLEPEQRCSAQPSPLRRALQPGPPSLFLPILRSYCSTESDLFGLEKTSDIIESRL